MKTKLSEQPAPSGDEDEPLFMAIPHDDPVMLAAYDRAFETVPVFIEHLNRQPTAIRSAKLRFRDPDESERLGEDRFVYLWLTNVHHYPKENCFSGVFFEMPTELQKWHQVGQQLIFESDSLFDWMILDQGSLYGGFTLRVARENLPESKRADYDIHVGVSIYRPLP